MSRPLNRRIRPDHMELTVEVLTSLLASFTYSAPTPSDSTRTTVERGFRGGTARRNRGEGLHHRPRGDKRPCESLFKLIKCGHNFVRFQEAAIKLVMGTMADTHPFFIASSHQVCPTKKGCCHIPNSTVPIDVQLCIRATCSRKKKTYTITYMSSISTKNY